LYPVRKTKFHPLTKIFDSENQNPSRKKFFVVFARKNFFLTIFFNKIFFLNNLKDFFCAQGARANAGDMWWEYRHAPYVFFFVKNFFPTQNFFSNRSEFSRRRINRRDSSTKLAARTARKKNLFNFVKKIFKKFC